MCLKKRPNISAASRYETRPKFILSLSNDENFFGKRPKAGYGPPKTTKPRTRPAATYPPCSFSRSASTSPAMGTRTCSMLSRSRMVTAWSSSVSKSIVTHSGVPISSCRR